MIPEAATASWRRTRSKPSPTRSVAYGDRGISQFYINVLLKEIGLSQADIDFVDLPADKAAEAFMLGEVDAAVTWEP
jgi:NitT/TauT family transport system substrate-binding protein